MEGVVFLDLETTGLDPERHKIYEIGLIDGENEYNWFLNPDHLDLENADPTALRITNFYGRFDAWWTEKGREGLPDYQVAKKVAQITSQKHLVGAVPSFDADFLGRWLRSHGLAPAWHYHLVDVEAMVAGRLQIAPPWDSERLAAALGVDVVRGEKHTALGDARWAKVVYEAVMQPDD